MNILNRPGWANRQILTESRKGHKYKLANRIADMFDKRSLGKSAYNNIGKIMDVLVADKPPYYARNLSQLIARVIQENPGILSKGERFLNIKVDEAIDKFNITDEEIERAARLVGNVFSTEKTGFNAVKRGDVPDFEQEGFDRKYDYTLDEVLENFKDVSLRLNTSIFDIDRAGVIGYPYIGEYNDKPVTVMLARQYDDGVKLGDVNPSDIISFRLLKRNADEDPNNIDINRSIIDVRFKGPSIDFNEQDPDELPGYSEPEEPEYKKVLRELELERERKRMRDSLKESKALSKAQRDGLLHEQRIKSKQHLQYIEEKYQY